MTTECIAIIGATATVLAGFGGATLGAVFAYKTGIKLIQYQEFNKGAVIFRIAFLDTIYKLRKNVGRGDVFLHDIITDNVFN